MSYKDTKYLTVEQISAMLQLHWQTVLDLIKGGDLPATKVGKSYRVEETELKDFLLKNATSGINLMSDRFRERVKEITSSPKYKDVRLIILGGGINHTLDEIFSENSLVYKTIIKEDRLRPMGWDIDLRSERPKPVLGEYLGYEDRVRFIRVYRDGMLIAGGVADPNFLGWGTQDFDEAEKTEEKGIHELAVAEFCANFSKKIAEIANGLNIGKELLVAVTIHNPRINKLFLRKTIGHAFPSEQVGEYFQVKERSSYLFVKSSKNQYDAEKIAATLWKEICYIFGLTDSQIRYLTHEGKMDFDSISKIT